MCIVEIGCVRVDYVSIMGTKDLFPILIDDILTQEAILGLGHSAIYRPADISL